VTRASGLVDAVQPATVQNDGERTEKPANKGARS
jgi:hypothetical protein